jgi:hypothetical protein
MSIMVLVSGYIESYKVSKKDFEKYISTEYVPADITFKLLKDKYHLINGIMNRLLTLPKELNTTNPVRVPENNIQDKSENALETVVNHYKEQYRYASKRLEAITNS